METETTHWWRDSIVNVYEVSNFLNKNHLKPGEFIIERANEMEFLIFYWHPYSPESKEV